MSKPMSPGRQNDDVMFGSASQDALTEEDGMLREKISDGPLEMGNTLGKAMPKSKDPSVSIFGSMNKINKIKWRLTKPTSLVTRKHKCRKCFCAFEVRSTLMAHLKTHSEKLRCQFCMEMFSTKPSLKVHERIHKDAIFEACKDGDLNRLQLHLQGSTLVDLRDYDENTPLMISSLNGYLDMVAKLLSLGADVNAQNNKGDTSLILATSIDVVKLLLDDKRLHLEEKNSTGMSALMSAIEKSDLSKIQLLINAGSSVRHNLLVLALKAQHAEPQLLQHLVFLGVPINQYDGSGRLLFKDSAILSAFEDASISAVNTLFGLGAVLDCDYAIKHALMTKNQIMLKFLIEEFFQSIKDLFENPETFILAVQIGYIDNIQILIDAGAEINRVFHQKTPLMSALDAETIHFLAQNGANVNLKTNKTPLINSVSYEYSTMASNVLEHITPQKLEQNILSIIESLLKNGALINDTDALGSTALIIAARSDCSSEIIKCLLEKKANVNLKNNQGSTALLEAAKQYKLEFIEVLIANGACVNEKDCDGFTPLHVAVGNVEVVKMLLKSGAKVDAVDYLGNSPLSIASEHEADIHEVIEVLIDSGANVNQRNDAKMTPIWIAAHNYNQKSISSLLKAKAVDVDEREKKSTLSLLLNKWILSEQSLQTALTLLNLGASANFVRCDVIHRLVATNNSSALISKLIKIGFAPTEVFLEKKIFNWPSLSLSPLTICLILEKVELANDLVNNCYLTRNDIKLMSNVNIVAKLDQRKTKAISFLERMSRQPLPLELLSLTIVSTSLGADRGRHQRITELELSLPLQENLLFTNIELSTCKPAARADSFLQQLAKYQAVEKDKSSSFYHLDDSYYEPTSSSD